MILVEVKKIPIKMAGVDTGDNLAIEFDFVQENYYCMVLSVVAIYLCYFVML